MNIFIVLQQVPTIIVALHIIVRRVQTMSSTESVTRDRCLILVLMTMSGLGDSKSSATKPNRRTVGMSQYDQTRTLTRGVVSSLNQTKEDIVFIDKRQSEINDPVNHYSLFV